MEKPEWVTRRQVLAGMGILAVAAIPGVVGGGALTRSGLGATPAARRVASLIADGPAVAELGGAYLATRTDHPDAQQLLAELLPSRMSQAEVEALADERLRTLLHEAVVRDFSAGRTVSVQGWLLSSTEARIAGLVRTLRP